MRGDWSCLNKNNSKRVYQLVKDLTSKKQGRSSTIQDRSRNVLLKNKRFLADEQNIAQNCTTMRVVVTTQYAGSPRKKTCKRSSVRKFANDSPWGSWDCSSITGKGEACRSWYYTSRTCSSWRETMIDVLTEICNRIWRTGEWSTPWNQSLIITLPLKGQLTALPELQSHQPQQSHEENHAETYLE